MAQSQITEAFVQQFAANVFHLAQQKGSRLRPYVRVEQQRGLSQSYDRIGSVSAVKKVDRHGDTPVLDTPHSRRTVGLNDYVWADLIDNEDKIRMLNDPSSEYAQAAMWAMGRAMDDEIIAAALGNAASGSSFTGTGSSNVILPATQYIAAVNSTSGTAVLSNLNVETLVRVKSKFGVNDVDSGKLHMAITQSQLDALLNETKVTSRDYTGVQALVKGEVDEFMGFQFHRVQRLPTAGSGSFLAATTLTTSGHGVVALSTGNLNNARRCFAWAEDGLLLAVGNDMEGKIDVRPDKNYATQVFSRMSIGAVRMEEAKVVGVLCIES